MKLSNLPITLAVLVVGSFFAYEGCISGCCNTCPPAQTIVIACDRDGGSDALEDESFEDDKSAEALALSSPCARACKQLSALGCPEAKKPVGGRTCVETCKAIAPISSYDPECVIKAKTVASARLCPALKCEKK